MTNSTIILLRENLKKFRNKKGITQGEVAELAGISPDYISEIERGKKIPSLKRLILIADALGVEVKDLFS